MWTLSSPAARFDRRLPPRPSTTAGSRLLSWSWVCGSLSPCGTGSTTDPDSQWLQAPLLFVPACEVNAGLCTSSRRLVRRPSRRDVVPQRKTPVLMLWGHIPRLKRPRTSRRLGRNAFIRNATQNTKQFAAGQSFHGLSRAMFVHRASSLRGRE